MALFNIRVREHQPSIPAQSEHDFRQVSLRDGPATFTLISSLRSNSKSDIDLGAFEVGVTPTVLLADIPLLLE